MKVLCFLRQMAKGRRQGERDTGIGGKPFVCQKEVSGRVGTEGSWEDDKTNHLSGSEAP